MLTFLLKNKALIFVLGMTIMILALLVNRFFQEEKTKAKAKANTTLEVTDEIVIEKLRIQKNQASTLSTARSGDEFVFNVGMRFLQSNVDVQQNIKFIENWSNPVDPTGTNRYWRDVAYLYKYFASLKAMALKNEGKLPKRLTNVIIPFEKACETACL